MALSRIPAPIKRACLAAIGSEKNIQTCAPLPERERSTKNGIFKDKHASENAVTQFFQSDLSKSTASNLH